MRNLPAAPQDNDGEEFRINEDHDPKKELTRFLRQYGLPSNNLPTTEDGDVIVSELLDLLPENIDQGSNNAARMALSDFYGALDSSLKARGFSVDPNTLLSLLLERVELHYYIGRESIRTCTGKRCDDYNACPFSDLDVVKNADREDSLDCMVDKETVNNLIEEYLITPDNPDGKIDPRKTAQASLFKQLTGLIVIQNRIMIRIKQDPVAVKKWEVLQDGPIEHFDSKNYTEHPLLARWIRMQKEIRKMMKEMGISPREEMRQDRWENEEQEQSAERRGEEIASSLLKKNAREELEKLPEGSPEREALKRVVEGSQDDLKNKEIPESE